MSVSPRTQIFEYLDNLRVADLSADQLAHVLACRRAVENAEPLPALEYETRELTIEERLYRTAQDFRSWGAPEDLIGQDLAWKLIRLGYSTDDAEELLRSVGVTWSADRAA